MKRSSFKLISVAVVVFIAMFVLRRAARAEPYAYTTIDVSNPVGQTYATGINDDGEIAGFYMDSPGKEQGFMIDADKPPTYWFQCNYPNAAWTFIWDINDSRDVVGSYFDGSNVYGFMSPNIWGSSAGTTIADPNAAGQTYAAGINNNGDIVGYYLDSSGEHGFLYNGTTYTTLDDPNGTDDTFATGINDSGDIVGYYMDGTSEHGFLYNGTTYTTLDDPNAINGTSAMGINDRGDIVGSYTDSSGNTHGFLYNGTTHKYTTMDDPNADGMTSMSGINESDQIVGWYKDSSGDIHGFLATPQDGGLWESATPLGGDWYDLSPFGSFYTNSSPWIYHQALGWLYPYGFWTNGVWFYDPRWDGHGQWWWTSAWVYPWIYSHPDGGWLYFDAAASTPSVRWFYNSLTGWAQH